MLSTAGRYPGGDDGERLHRYCNPQSEGDPRREIADPRAHGLYVVVQPSEKDSFAVRYRFGGTPRKLTLPEQRVVAAGISSSSPFKSGSDHGPVADCTPDRAPISSAGCTPERTATH
jgi:hypothetical protein